jgi:hypothetical protein
MRTQEDFDEFHSAITQLIALNKRFRPIEQRLNLSVSNWAEEFCTIKCDIGRQSGKSSYINNVAEEGDLIVVMNQHLKNQLANTKCEIMTASGISRSHINGKVYNTIFVDEPGFVFGLVERTKFYDYLAHNGEQTFVMLGI